VCCVEKLAKKAASGSGYFWIPKIQEQIKTVSFPSNVVCCFSCYKNWPRCWGTKLLQSCQALKLSSFICDIFQMVLIH